MRPDHIESLRAAKWKLQAKLMCDLDETAVNEMFYDQCFDSFVEALLKDDEESQPKRRRKAGDVE